MSNKQTDAIYKRIEEFSSSPGHNFTVEDFADERKCERASEDHGTFREVEKMISRLGDIVNQGGEDIIRAALVNGTPKVHRYLQDKLVIVLLQSLGDLGLLHKENPARFSDARNEFSMKLLEKLRERFKDELFWRDGS